MATIARAALGQRRALFVPREQLLARRDRRVRETVEHAAAHVPHYRDLFRREGIDPREIRGADDLARLPVVSRDEVLRDPERFRSDDASERDGLVLQSTGTTGVPLRLLHDRRSVLLNVAYAERERMVEAGLVGKRLRYTRLYLGSDSPENVDRVRGMMDRYELPPVPPPLPSGGARRPHARARRRGHRRHSSGRPDGLRLASRGVLSRRRRRAAGRGTSRRCSSTRGITCRPAGRRLIEEHFGIPVVSRYSAMESLKIGFYCERREGFHLHEDLCHVTIVDPPAHPCPTASPAKSCSRTSSTAAVSSSTTGSATSGGSRRSSAAAAGPRRCLRSSKGGSASTCTLADGSLMGPFGVTMAVSGIAGVVRYQLVQLTGTSFELRLATVDRAAFDRAAPVVEDAVREILGGYEVEATYVEDVEIEPGKKYRPIVLLDSPTG